MQEITITDPFGRALALYSDGLEVGLEIGGGTGDGSTQCIKTKTLVSLEIHPERIGRHKMNLDSRGGGIAINALSSNPKLWMSENEVVSFYNSIKTNLNSYKIEEVLEWLKADLEVSKNYKHGSFYLGYEVDFLLLDGGAFSGRADFLEWFPRVKEGGVIALDDINDIKNHGNHLWLQEANHQLLWFEPKWRNGCAIYKK